MADFPTKMVEPTIELTASSTKLTREERTQKANLSAPVGKMELVQADCLPAATEAPNAHATRLEPPEIMESNIQECMNRLSIEIASLKETIDSRRPSETKANENLPKCASIAEINENSADESEGITSLDNEKPREIMMPPPPLIDDKLLSRAAGMYRIMSGLHSSSIFRTTILGIAARINPRRDLTKFASPPQHVATSHSLEIKKSASIEGQNQFSQQKNIGKYARTVKSILKRRQLETDHQHPLALQDAFSQKSISAPDLRLLKDESFQSANEFIPSEPSLSPVRSQSSRSLSFKLDEVLVIPVHSKMLYNRKPDSNITVKKLTSKLRMEIREELNVFKSQEMAVHESSVQHTLYH